MFLKKRLFGIVIGLSTSFVWVGITSPVRAQTVLPNFYTAPPLSCTPTAAMPHISAGTVNIVDTKGYTKCNDPAQELKMRAYLYYDQAIGWSTYLASAPPSPIAVNYGKSRITTRHSEINCSTLDLNPNYYEGEAVLWVNGGPGQDAPVQTNTVYCG